MSLPTSRPAEPRTRGRLLLMGHLMQFSLQRRMSDGEAYAGRSQDAFSGHARDAIPGDLVAVHTARPDKWYLGWLVEKEVAAPPREPRYLIESVEDGELCWWDNVALVHYDRETVRSHPQWRWTDAQHDFAERWYEVCRQDKDAYMYLPIAPTFDGNAVELGVRVRLGFSPTVIRETFPNWRRTSRKAMGDFYDRAEAALKAEADGGTTERTR